MGNTQIREQFRVRSHGEISCMYTKYTVCIILVYFYYFEYLSNYFKHYFLTFMILMFQILNEEDMLYAVMCICVCINNE